VSALAGKGAVNTTTRRLVGSTTARVVVGLVALGVLYVVVPIDTRTTAGAVAVLVVATLVFVAVTVRSLGTLRRSRRPVADAIWFLMLILALFVIGFAVTYLAMHQVNPDSFSEPLTKVSAVYFTVSVLATVGFGDVAATSEVARMVVTAQMVSGLTLLAVLTRYVMKVASTRKALVDAPGGGAGSEPTTGAGGAPADHPRE
jgi:uncharacterized membrane protein